MKTPGPLFCAALLLASAAAGAWALVANSFWLGQQNLIARAILFPLPALAVLAGVRALLPAHSPRAARLLALSGIFALLGGFGYFLWWMPRGANAALGIEITGHSLLTDSSSNALVELGFAYPVFTPAVALRNGGLFSREIDVYLRMIDSGGQSMLYRAARAAPPPGILSVEASLGGILGANRRYLLLPLRLAPGEEIAGRLVFVIAAFDDGASFMRELSRARLLRLELRAAGDGKLLLEVPMRL